MERRAALVLEKEEASQFDSAGLTLSCQSMLSFGPKARRGLSSPADRKAETGDAFTLAFAPVILFGFPSLLERRSGPVFH